MQALSSPWGLHPHSLCTSQGLTLLRLLPGTGFPPRKAGGTQTGRPQHTAQPSLFSIVPLKLTYLNTTLFWLRPSLNSFLHVFYIAADETMCNSFVASRSPNRRSLCPLTSIFGLSAILDGSDDKIQNSQPAWSSHLHCYHTEDWRSLLSCLPLPTYPTNSLQALLHTSARGNLDA